jgi:AraC family transcriptional activator of mtrCDE
MPAGASGWTCSADTSPSRPPHDRLLRSYLPPRLVVHAGSRAEQKDTAAQLVGLVSLMRSESGDDHLGGSAMLNALSTAMFALVLRLASETEHAPRGEPARRDQSQ